MVRALFIVNGLGLGNSTRCHAIMQHLQDHDIRIQVITSGNGIWYFEHHHEAVESVHAMEPLFYGDSGGRLSVFRTLAAIPSLVAISRKNAVLIDCILEDFRPDVVVIDSTYTYRPVRRRRIPIVAINNADMVRQSYRMFADRPSSIRNQFYAIEMMDYLFHATVPDVTISPVLDSNMMTSNSRFRRVGPIVRRNFIPVEVKSDATNVIIMLSGSKFGTPVNLAGEAYPANFDIIGRRAPDGHRPRAGITYHDRIADTYSLIKNADLCVVNGGFSAVSEIYWVRKPMIVIPVPGHAEQWINGRTIEHLGVGIMAEERDLERAILKTLGQLERLSRGYDELPAPEDGAANAAEIIMSTAMAGKVRHS